MSLLLNLFFCKINEFNFADISFLSFFFRCNFFQFSETDNERENQFILQVAINLT